MTSLAEAYEGHVGEVRSLRRLYLGAGLFVSGTLLVVAGIVAATTDALAAVGLGGFAAKHAAGVLAGLGVPAVFVGVFTVLPASERVRAAAAIGASVAILGVALFWYAYPAHWDGHGQHLTLPVVAVYFFGTITTFWCLFTAVVNFKTRNDPGGTVTLELLHEGQTRTVEVARTDLEDTGSAFGGVGILGNVVDEVEDAGGRATGPAPASDGGSTSDEIRTPAGTAAARSDEPSRSTSAADTYCGNCRQFRYVRTENGMEPYCDYHDGRMDDMDACDRWEPNDRR